MLFRQTTMRARLALTFGIVVALVLWVSGLALGDANNGAIASNLDVTEKTRSLVAEIHRIEARDSLVALSIADAALHDQREQAIVGIDSVSPATDRARRPNRCLCQSMRGTSQLTRTSEPDATRSFNCLRLSRASCIDGLAATQ
nr:hypothetical protein [Burkholderia ambifaria]